MRRSFLPCLTRSDPAVASLAPTAAASLVVAVAVTVATSSAARGQAILAPDSVADVVWALDAVTGDPLGSFDVSGFVDVPINVIDGPDGGLLLSDQLEDMIFRLDGRGNLIGNHLQNPIDNIRGIHRFPNDIVAGATANGIYFWDADGSMLRGKINGDFFDVNVDDRGLILGTNIDTDTLQAYSLGLTFVGESRPGAMNFPQQVALTEAGRAVVANFSVGEVCAFAPNGIEIRRHPIRNNGGGRGVIELGNGNFLVSDSTNGVDEYDADGNFIRNVLAPGGTRYLEYCENYRR